MEITWELMGLNDGWKSEKVKVCCKNFKKCREKKTVDLFFYDCISQHDQIYNLLVQDGVVVESRVIPSGKKIYRLKVSRSEFKDTGLQLYILNLIHIRQSF